MKNFKTIERLENLINENNLNNLGLEMSHRCKFEAMQTARRNTKLNKSLLSDNLNDAVTRLNLKTKNGLEWFSIRPDHYKKLEYFIKIELIRFFYVDKAQADKIILL